jgi:glycosyltransferase involved in cell wall biosynthesis
MRYAMFDIEVTQPICDLVLSSADAGAAILVRRKGVPIGFWMQERNGALSVPASQLAERIAAEAGVRIVAEALREEMMKLSPTIASPSLTIAICTKDRPDGVERLLRSLSMHISTRPQGNAPPEILLVDNAPSDDSTRALASRRPEVRYLCEPRPGLNFARNLAVREAHGEILAFLDDDVIPDRGWLEGLADAWGANLDAAAFTGQVLPLELETDAQVVFEQRGGFRRAFHRIRYGPVLPGDPMYPGGAGNFGAGANMAFRTDAIRALGGFDEALDTGAAVPGGGDLDIFYRVIRAGLALVYEPRFLAFHQHRREMGALRRQYRRSWGLGFMCYLTKCLKTDPERRINLLRLIVWWFANHARGVLDHLVKSTRGREHVPPSLLVGELWGGFCGLLGGYARSVRRIEKIRRQHS